MHDVLRVDPDNLHEQSALLKALRRDLDADTMLGTVDYYRGYLGSGMLADHIDGVMNNWNRNHQQVVQQITDLATATTNAADSFHDLDTTLGHAVDPHAGGAK